jgi:hypothetical protein
MGQNRTSPASFNLRRPYNAELGQVPLRALTDALLSFAFVKGSGLVESRF